jgi:hypothetical protein
MRYTLRLLTVQQFQRATALLCACEFIRREDPAAWGESPFRLGLWVGKKNTPNTLQQAAEVLQQAQGDRYSAATSRIGTPHQITTCPWCGERIGLQHLKVYGAPRRHRAGRDLLRRWPGPLPVLRSPGAPRRVAGDGGG